MERELQTGSISSVINLVDFLLEEAHAAKASDIHFDPQPDKIRVRFRVDGVLIDKYGLPKGIQSEIISRVKILAGLRTDEHQAAQDGRFRLSRGLAQADVRVSIAPTYHGENAVLRLLSDRASEYNLETLGFSAVNRKIITQALQKPYGMILATGPTGSGKTTTLYAMLKKLNTPEASIVTIEDPIEYSLPGVNQIGVNPRAGLNFANGLRSILRQDPNIIMVGEIRDTETAGLAVNTALTGHLLLSTLHTNDATTTLPRLIDMGIEPYLIASTVNIAIGQRLVRQICRHCKAQKSLSRGQLHSLQNLLPALPIHKDPIVYQGEGCTACGNSGFAGRIGLQEILVMDTALRESVLQKDSAARLRALALQRGFETMAADGWRKVSEGLTTVDELLRTQYE